MFKTRKRPENLRKRTESTIVGGTDIANASSTTTVGDTDNNNNNNNTEAPIEQTENNEEDDGNKNAITDMAPPTDITVRKRRPRGGLLITKVTSSSAKHKDTTSKAEEFAFSSSESAKPEGEGDQFAAILVPKKEEEKKKLDKIDEASGKRIYRGLDAYTKPNQQPRAAGPSKSSTNLRVTCRFDYQPDICKDYKETGYCGYGDSCKFLHDRGDYKTGWQLEEEWEEEQKKKRSRALLQAAANAANSESEEDDDDEDEFLIDEKSELPFSCLICRGPFVKPVSTRCRHYFCESCALTRYAQDCRCAVCKENTCGIFNVANDIMKKIQLIQQANKRKRTKKKPKIEPNNNNNDDDEDDDDDPPVNK